MGTKAKSTTLIYCRCEWCNTFFEVKKRMKYCTRSCRQKQSYQTKRVTKAFEETGIVSEKLGKTIKLTHLVAVSSLDFKKYMTGERDFLVTKTNKTTKRGDSVIIRELNIKTGNKSGRQLSRVIVRVAQKVDGVDDGSIVLYI